MKRIVIDTSAVMNVLLRLEHAERVRQEAMNAVLIAPRCLPYEVGNALVNTMRKTRNSDRPLTLDAARDVLSMFSDIPFTFEWTSVQSAVVRSVQHGSFAYDMYYLDMALRLAVPLLTLDRGQRRAALDSGAQVLPVGLYAEESGADAPA